MVKKAKKATDVLSIRLGPVLRSELERKLAELRKRDGNDGLGLSDVVRMAVRCWRPGVDAAAADALSDLLESHDQLLDAATDHGALREGFEEDVAAAAAARAVLRPNRKGEARP